MKIALIQCPVWGTYDPPIALAQLSSCLKKENHEVYALDLNIELYLNRKENYKDIWAWEQSSFWYDSNLVNKFFEENTAIINKHLIRIFKLAPQVVCFSVSTASRVASLELARLIKKEKKDIIIIFGGTLFFDKRWIELVLNEEAVDIVVYGEGEATLCELAGLIENRKNINFCKGICYRHNDSIVNTGERLLKKNIDELPYLDFSDLPLGNYDDSTHIALITSRGCILHCVFCSSREFWPGYRTMSGERIFSEIRFHKEKHKDLGHIDFLDLVFNGNMKTLENFCDLMMGEKFNPSINWTANAIIRPEMATGVIQKVRRSGCEHLIYGIETGSQRILDSMRKKYNVSDADNVIRETHNAGIMVTGNFMFGFPGETEEDFQMTLDFIKRNAKYLDRVYPSRTYCAIEESSYLANHLEEFNIKPNPPNHLYWESADTKNNYIERLRRCEEFCKLASSLGIEVGCGVQTSVELDRWSNLASYYETKKDIKNMLDCYLKCYELEPKNEITGKKIISYSTEIEKYETGSIIGLDLLSRLKKAVNLINSVPTYPLPAKGLGKSRREKSILIAKSEQRDNAQLNEDEFNNKKVLLHSTPKALFLQASGPCNFSCNFCSRGNDYEMFDLKIFRERFEEKLFTCLTRAEEIVLTGSGEFLLLPEGEGVLDYFDINFPHVNKMFSTNGTSLNPKICEKIAKSKSKYTIHVSLHASNSRLHKVITQTESFHKILGQLNYLLKIRENTGNPAINLIFVATTLNIEDLPNFVKLSAKMGVDKVVCYYNYIYIPTQKYLSCFFKQELTNLILDEAKEVAKQLNVKIDLPPKFSQKEYPLSAICREPWNQIMFDLKGRVLPCDASEDCSENIEKVELFQDVWNGDYYCKLRKALISGTSSCFKYCLRANPQSVNDFRSHVIRRGKKESEIGVLWGDNF